MLLTLFKPFWLRVVRGAIRIISQQRLQSWKFHYDSDLVSYPHKQGDFAGSEVLCFCIR